MNFEPNRQSRLIRCAFAAGALVATLTLGAFIDGLAKHSSVETRSYSAVPGASSSRSAASQEMQPALLDPALRSPDGVAYPG